jgi:hypothetical protein|tara:strand:- start:555 stop:737 length:183 start_codon:yes stop_codon:yes gene_type:complete
LISVVSANKKLNELKNIIKNKIINFFGLKGIKLFVVKKMAKKRPCPKYNLGQDLIFLFVN